MRPRGQDRAEAEGIRMLLRPRIMPAAAMGLALLGSSAAHAIEPDAVAKALGAALIKGSNVTASYQAARADGGNVVIDGLTLSRSSAEETVRFDKVVVESPATGGSGIFESPLITFDSGTLSGDSKGTIGAASISDAIVLDVAEKKGDALGEGILFHNAEIRDIAVSREDDPGQVSIARISAEAGNVVDNVAQDNKGTAESVTLSPDMFPASLSPSTIGYDKLVFDVSWDSTRDVAAKTLTIRDFTIHVHDGGDLAISGVMGNLPDPRVLDDAGAASKASGAEVHALTVRYDDKSLAGRILDALAERQGLSRDEYTQQLSAALPFLLLTLNNPTFQNQVSTAIASFLKDPQSLTIRLAPEKPVSGAEILSLLKSAPGSVPDKLNASVSANAPE
jgi:hypothetical protein